MWRATIEPGLPAYSEAAVHLHDGTPTPWRQGVVVRFSHDDGRSWVVNAKPGHGYRTDVWPWPEAGAFIVVAAGNAFLVKPDRPADWRYLTTLAISHLIDLSGARVFIATYTDVLSADSQGLTLWSRRVAIDGVELASLHGGVLEGRACMDPPDDWRAFRLGGDDGRDA